MNANGQLIDILARSRMFKTYERAHTEVTGMPMTLRPVDTWRLAFHGKRKENAFCAVMSEQSRTCVACLQLQEKLTQAARTKPATRTCAYGLCETAVPVKLGPQTIGFLQTGQVMSRKPTETTFRRAVDQARQLGVDIDNERTRRAYFKTPVVPPGKLHSVSNLLAIFADQLAMKSNQLVVQTTHVEPPIITRARQFILEHYTEDLSLGQVSRAMNTSRFYFCKQFHQAAGLTFIEFLSRTRIEKAKNFLLNPNLRISEIAFAVGFQSLTHFNRVFKSITGQSPTKYRGGLSAVTGSQLAGVTSVYPLREVNQVFAQNGSDRRQPSPKAQVGNGWSREIRGVRNSPPIKINAPEAGIFGGNSAGLGMALRAAG